MVLKKMCHYGHQASLLLFLSWLKLSEISLPSPLSKFHLFPHENTEPERYCLLFDGVKRKKKVKRKLVSRSLGEAPVSHPTAVEMAVKGLPGCYWPSSETGALGREGR